MAEEKSIAELLAEADAALREKEDELRCKGYDIPPAEPSRNMASSIRKRTRVVARALAEERARGVDPERPAVGSVAGERSMAMYTPGREGVTYPRSGLWIVVGILVVLFVVFFGFILLWH